MEIINSLSGKETESAGEYLGKKLNENTVVALFGELGAGKTAFTRGLVRGFGVNCRVSSPTFAIVNEYKENDKTVYHFDMYRISGIDDLESTGFFDYLDSGAVLVIEWSENILSYLPDNCIRVIIGKTENENERIIKIGRGETLEDIGC
ncbi:MAG: tRNA (adenosine(37)-N6)-threonylcarbamoyltransferase complex ATPase subunit type 1 TsaE [Clostridia bacterium]|nr:tRNA (adenosine(37)-N6)-threonylcarbamoyltransferase complex ATPase subunit type 1 TsaE [Clostridia bacterium]